MKGLVTSDWHSDAATMGVPRYADVKRAAEATVAAAIENKVDFYAFTGDLADPDVSGATLLATALAVDCALVLANHGIPSVWLAGNHDVAVDGTGATTLTPLARLAKFYPEVVRVFERPGVTSVRNRFRNDEWPLDIVCLPYVLPSAKLPDDFSAEALQRSVRKSRKRAVLAHLSLRGIRPGEETDAMPRGAEVVLDDELLARGDYAFVVNGHYHQQQVHTCPSGLKVHIPGALARFKFGEQSNPVGYLIVEV